MSANLSYSSAGSVNFAYQDASPWHKQGHRLPAGAGVDQALDAAGLRYTVTKAPITLADGTPISEFVATMRDDGDGSPARFLSVVGKAYVPVQATEATDIVRGMVDLGASVATAGALDEGRKAFMLIKMGTSIQVLDGDEVRGYSLLHWSHDGNSGVVSLFTPIRVVCQNTLSAALNGSKRNAVSIKHTTSAQARVSAAGQLMTRLYETLQATGKTFNDMARLALNPAQLAAYIEAVVPNPEPAKTLSPVLQARRDTIARLMVAGRGADMANQAMASGQVSAWAAYNAITEYFDHVRPAEAKSPAGVARANESAVFGANADAKIFALQLARQLVAA